MEKSAWRLISFPWVPPRVHHQRSQMLQFELTQAKKKKSIHLLSPYKVNSFRNPFFHPSIYQPYDFISKV